MSDLEVGLLVVVVLLAVVVFALVRAQAVTSRRLALLERRLLRAQRRTEAALDPVPTTPGDTMTIPTTSSASSAGDDLVDLRGVTVDGEQTEYALETLETPTLVAFLSTTCGICLSLWERLRDEGLDGVPAVVVTKDAAVEKVDVVRDMTDSGSLPVVMSSEAWDDYEVPGSPYFLVVGGDPGVILAEGEASSWDEVRSLARQSHPAIRS